jgi:hypothetical protein
LKPLIKKIIIIDTILKLKSNTLHYNRGLYIGKYPLPGGGYQLMSFGGKNMKKQREKRGTCKRKRKKGERK